MTKRTHFHVTMTESGLMGLCVTESRHQFAEIETSTPVRMRKRNNPLASHDVRSENRLNVRLNGSYTAAMRRELGEPDWTPGPRPWGERVADTMVITHKGRYYLEYFPRDINGHRYTVDGRPATESEVQTIREFRTTKGTGIVRCVKFENVKTVTVGGVVHTVTH